MRNAGIPQVPCTTSCGVSGTITNGACIAAEVCNSCDDDRDGHVDEGLKCAHLSLESRCSAPSTIDAHIEANDSIGTSWALMYQKWGPGSPYVVDTRKKTARTSYPSHANVSWRFLASAAAQKTILHYQGIQLEAGARLTYAAPQGLGVVVGELNHLSPSEQDIELWGAQMFSANFKSDEARMPSRYGAGLQLRFVTTICAPGKFTPAVESVSVDRWTYGALAEAGDTRFFEVVASPENDTIVLVDAQADIDLYLREGELPTAGVYDVASQGSGAGDFIVIPRGSGSHFLAVQAYSAATWYRIKASVFKPDNTRRVRAGFASSPSATTLDTADAAFKQAQRRIFGLTNGQFAIVSAHLYNEHTNWLGECMCAQGFCDVCFRQASGRSFAIPGNQVTMFFEPYTQWYSPWVLAHEFGHSLLLLPDEYTDHGNNAQASEFHSDAFCDTSTMGYPSNNRLCVESNHGVDSDPPAHVCAPGSPEAWAWYPAVGHCPTQRPAMDSMWTNMRDRFGLEPPATQPENVNFNDFVWLDPMFLRY